MKKNKFHAVRDHVYCIEVEKNLFQITLFQRIQSHPKSACRGDTNGSKLFYGVIFYLGFVEETGQEC